ncbi:MAG: glycosyltransferase, partial [Patescibacteria group bacterium]
MNILHVSLWPIDRKSIGGTEKYIICLSSALKELSIDNEVLMLSGKETTINKVHYIPLSLSSIKKLDEYSIKKIFFNKFNIKALQEFAKKIESDFDFSKYDIIHFNSLLFYFCAFNKKRIFTIHINQIGFEQNWGKNSFGIISKIIRNDKDSKTAFIVPSKYYADDYRKKFAKKIAIIPHSLPESFSKEKMAGRKQDEDKCYLNILVPSRLEIKQKGQDLLL